MAMKCSCALHLPFDDGGYPRKTLNCQLKCTFELCWVHFAYFWARLGMVHLLCCHFTPGWVLFDGLSISESCWIHLTYPGQTWPPCILSTVILGYSLCHLMLRNLLEGLSQPICILCWIVVLPASYPSHVLCCSLLCKCEGVVKWLFRARQKAFLKAYTD